jgi:hypothetical protein
LLAESLHQWEAVSADHFDYYERYEPAEWAFMKEIILKVKRHWGLQPR